MQAYSLVACSTSLRRAFVTPCADFDFIELQVNNAHAVMAGELRPETQLSTIMRKE